MRTTFLTLCIGRETAPTLSSSDIPANLTTRTPILPTEDTTGHTA